MKPIEYKQIRLPEPVDKKLSEISWYRKAKGEIVNSKQGIISELIIAAHKKEMPRDSEK